MKGLHHEMQIALKSSPKFSAAYLNELAKETTRLQIAGIESAGPPTTEGGRGPWPPTFFQIMPLWNLFIC